MTDLSLGDTRLIIQVCQKLGLLRNQTAYVLATAFWETARTMEPVRETLAASDESAIARLENAWAKGRLPWVSTPYWRGGYFGRGYVQLTHEVNYAKAGRYLGADLVQHPDKALQPDIAAVILVMGMRDGWFTGKKLSDYITLKQSDYRGARRIVNGTDKAAAIAELAREYEQALINDGFGVEKAPPVVNERLDGSAPKESRAQSTTLQAAVGQVGAAGAGAIAAFNGLDGTAQLVALGICGAVILLAMWIGRERLKKWADGVR